ncbi:MAG TPA: DNRLRE domain-containing protein [Candidatus Limnocylindrales bacterium]|nr:DNRLRE domain-containing protein [Candidatus Limnocylindrales bacterium]
MRRGRLHALTYACLLAVAAGVAVQTGAAASLSVGSQQITPYRSCTITATPSSTTAVIDAGVSQATPTTNAGSSTTNIVSSAATANRRAYVWFDLTQCSPTIPSTATVRLATLRIYASGLPAACRTIDIFRTTATWTESAITWNNQPFGTTLNNPAQSSRTASFNVGTPSGCQNLAAGYVAGATVTSDVAAFVSGTANYGWMLRDDVEASATTRTTTFSAKNLGTLAQAPQLVITYT